MTGGQKSEVVWTVEKGAVCAVDPVRCDAAALLVREVDDIETRVMDIVARSDEDPPVQTAMWRIWAEPAGLER